MKKLKDLCLGVLLKEGEEIFSLSPGEVGNVIDVDMVGDDVKIKFETSYGKPLDLIVKMEVFKNWASRKDAEDVFRHFVVDFISNSKESSEDLTEIVDDNGDIDLDGDMPNNSTNSMVVSPKFDLEKIYKKFIPKSIRFMSGDMGFGAVTW
jgi:hypothetical protein